MNVNPNRLRERLQPILLVTGAIAGIVLLALLILDVAFPGIAAESGLGFETLGNTLHDQVKAVGALTGLSVTADLLLLAAAYVMVCVSLWAQRELRVYWTNRSRFR